MKNKINIKLQGKYSDYDLFYAKKNGKPKSDLPGTLN